MKGLTLASGFFNDLVQPILAAVEPDLKYDAALVGPGSEVLGLDDETSQDHHWGPRVILFLRESDFESMRNVLIQALSDQLPSSYQSFSTHWSLPNSNDSNNQFLITHDEGPVNHRIEITTVPLFLEQTIGRRNLPETDFDWLSLPEQALLEVTSGEVFHEGLGVLSSIRKHLKYYPDNVWRFKILSSWEKIGQEIAFVGRTRMREDWLGTRLETARLVRVLTHLSFLLSRRYMPYSKWSTVQLKTLELGKRMYPLLLCILETQDWREREDLLCDAYITVLKYQNHIGLTEALELSPKNYFDRPQQVIDVGIITSALKHNILPPLDNIPPIGGMDQFIDETNLLSTPHYYTRFTEWLKRLGCLSSKRKDPPVR